MVCISEQDQRNHGERLVDARGNTAWKDGNDRHAYVSRRTLVLDMYDILTSALHVSVSTCTRCRVRPM